MTAAESKNEGVITGLVRRKLCFVGFSPEESRTLAEGFSQSKCLSRAIDYGGLIPDSKDLVAFDLIIVYAGDETETQGWSPKTLAHVAVPILLVGPAEQAPRWSSLIREGRAVFIASPCDFDEILRLAHGRIISADERHLGTRQADASVLVADDDPRVTSLLRAIFTNLGLDCHVARNGREALSLIRTALPDLVYLDINMPGMSGFDVLTAVRLDPGTSSTLVVILSSSRAQPDIVKGSELKADNYVLKPFSTLDISSRTKKMLQHRGAAEEV